MKTELSRKERLWIASKINKLPIEVPVLTDQELINLYERLGIADIIADEAPKQKVLSLYKDAVSIKISEIHNMYGWEKLDNGVELTLSNLSNIGIRGVDVVNLEVMDKAGDMHYPDYRITELLNQ